MSKPLPAKATAAVIVLAIAVTGYVIFRPDASERESTAVATPPKASKVIVTIEGQGACTPGKAIGPYTCTDQDAGVAWLSAKTADGRPVVPMVGDNKDETGRRYDIIQSADPRVDFCRIIAGYKTKPQKLSLKVLGGRDASQKPVEIYIPIQELAAPRRYLQAPSPDAEKAIRVTIDDRNEVRAEIHPSPKELESLHEFAQATVLATTYCPEGAQPPDLDDYGKDTDLVKVRLDTYKIAESKATLTYKDAAVATINGIRILHLPTRQMVGKILGEEVFADKQMTIPTRAKPGRYINELHFAPGSGATADSELTPNIRFDSISPSVDSIGLDPLRLLLGGDITPIDLKPDPSYKGPLVTNIPELKVTLLMRSPIKVGSMTYVLPLHRIGKQPAKLDLFRSWHGPREHLFYTGQYVKHLVLN